MRAKFVYPWGCYNDIKKQVSKELRVFGIYPEVMMFLVVVNLRRVQAPPRLADTRLRIRLTARVEVRSTRRQPGAAIAAAGGPPGERGLARWRLLC